MQTLLLKWCLKTVCWPSLRTGETFLSFTLLSCLANPYLSYNASVICPTCPNAHRFWISGVWIHKILGCLLSRQASENYPLQQLQEHVKKLLLSSFPSLPALCYFTRTSSNWVKLLPFTWDSAAFGWAAASVFLLRSSQGLNIFNAMLGNSCGCAFTTRGRETSLTVFIIFSSFLPSSLLKSLAPMSSMSPFQAKREWLPGLNLLTCRGMKSLVKKNATVYNLCFIWTWKESWKFLKFLWTCSFKQK